MTTIIGLDGALAHSGLAIKRGPTMSVRTIHTHPHDPPEARWAHIGAQLWPIVGEDTLVMLEGVFAGAKTIGTALDLAMVHGTLRMGLHYRAIPFAIVDPIALKQYAVGSGKASKQEMIAATARLQLGFTVADDHQAEGCWLVAMACDHYGMPMCDTSPAGRAALKRIKWPSDWRPKQEAAWR